MSTGNGTALVKRDEFGGSQVAQVAETAAGALAAQAKASVEARYIMAMRQPRDLDDARVRILKDCRRSGFAEVARFKKPQGRKKNDKTGKWETNYVEGFSVRFAESAARAMTNILEERFTIYDDPARRIVRVCVTDLEANVTKSTEITIDKVVERKSQKEGQTVLGSRVNSYGDTVYMVEASEDEFLQKEGALASKASRNMTLKLVPGDILDEAEQVIAETQARKTAEDPDAARKRIVDAFAALGVKPSDLKIYLGHDVASCSPAELEDLRGIHAGIKTGETTWSKVLQDAQADGQSTDAPAGDQAPPADAPKSRKDAIKEQARAKSAAQQPPAYLDQAHAQVTALLKEGVETGWIGDAAYGGLSDEAAELRKRGGQDGLKGLQALAQKLESMRDAPQQAE